MVRIFLWIHSGKRAMLAGFLKLHSKQKCLKKQADHYGIYQDNSAEWGESKAIL